MITLNPSTLRTNPFADTSPSGSAITQQNVDPAGFASLLRQSQMAAPPPPPPMPEAAAPPPAAESQAKGNDESSSPPADASKTEANPAPEAPAQPEAARRARNAAKADGRRADGSSTTSDDRVAAKKANAAPDPSGSPQDATSASKPADTTPSGSGLDPSVMQWLAGLQGNPQATSQKADTGATGGDASPLGAGDPRGTVAAHRQASELRAQDEGQQTSLLGGLPAATGPAEFSALMAQRQEADAPTAEHTAAVDGIKDTAAAGAAALGSAFSPIPTAPAAPASVTVATPVNAPDFAQELGMHLSVLAKDGVQTAELHLNPADMGPVSVQIVMDGTQAHVAFGADMAATRQAIEAGLPQLAGALADAGFTLAGGGVSQHAGGRGGDDASGASTGSRGGRGRSVSSAAVSQVVSAARRVVNQGGVDLFA
jgi:flagellar hook-length control protein FliK